MKTLLFENHHLASNSVIEWVKSFDENYKEITLITDLIKFESNNFILNTCFYINRV